MENNPLPDAAFYDQTRKSVIINEDVMPVRSDKNDVNVLNIDKFIDVEEYSISGWAKWANPSEV